MNITKELRRVAVDTECASGRCEKLYRGDLERIADRIDAEHERVCIDAECERIYRDLTIDAEPMTDERMAEHGWVRLPKDADGEYIHIGDRMEDNERVARIVLTDGSWEPSVYVEKLPNVLHEYFCHEISHYHAPTVEDVLREFAAGICGQNADFAELVIAEYAAKLKLAEGEDE